MAQLTGLKTLSAEIAAEPEMAWAVFCNLAVPIREAARVSRQKSDEAAAHLMQHLFGHDITTDDRYEYGKSGAQNYAEMRIAMDEQEDAEIASREGAA